MNITKNRWTWCELCQCPRIRCKKCGNISCSGGGCLECRDEFAEAIDLLRQNLAPSEEECKSNVKAIKLDEEMLIALDDYGFDD